jgi:hypothetical protein
MKYIFDIVSREKNSNDLKNIIYINNKLLDDLNYKSYNKSYNAKYIKKYISGGSPISEKYTSQQKKNLDKLFESTNEIIDVLNGKINNKIDTMKKMSIAMSEFIVYIDLLYEKSLDEDLLTLKNQMTELNTKFENYIINNK